MNFCVVKLGMEASCRRLIGVLQGMPVVALLFVSQIVHNAGGAEGLATNSVAQMVGAPEEQRLAPGDTVSFQVVEDRAEAKQLVVSDSGELDVPYIGRLKVAERTCKDLIPEIKVKLEEKYYYQATVKLSVDLLNRSRGAVYLFGEVRAAGALQIPSDEVLTLAKAVIRAGGFTDFADRKKVRVTRESGSEKARVFLVDLSRVIQKGELDKDLRLERGDIIYVPTRLINF